MKKFSRQNFLPAGCLFDSEFFDGFLVRGHIRSLVHMINYHAGLGADGLLYLAHLRIIDRHHRRRASFRMICRNHGGFGHSLVGRLFSVSHQNNMRAVYLLRMEPDVTLEGGFQRQKIVLNIILPAKTSKPSVVR